MRLGRLPHLPHAVAAEPAHKYGLVPAPPKVDRSHITFQPGLYENDALPDCTAVALVNAARGVAALNGYGLVVEPACVPGFYSACIGNPPNLAGSDGARMLDVLHYQARHGYLIGPQMLVCTWGTVDPKNRQALARTIYCLGCLYCGVTLYERDLDRAGLGVWDYVAGRDDGSVVGGHAITAWDYNGLGDTATVRVATWGGWQNATWAWVNNRLDEAYGPVWRQLARADGHFYSGLTADDLVAESNEISEGRING